MKQQNELYKRQIGCYFGNEVTRVLAKAKHRQKLSATTQRNAEKLAKALATSAPTNKSRREQLKRALSK